MLLGKLQRKYQFRRTSISAVQQNITPTTQVLQALHQPRLK
jgi:hypothetical protein